jgi:hypothetical protein
MTSSNRRRGPERLVLPLALAAFLFACSEPGLSPPPPVAPTAARVGLEVDSRLHAPGERLRVTVVAEAPEGGWAGVQGWVRFDPRALRYVGQPLTGDALILVNPSRAEQGELRLASLRVAGLARATADLRFDVLQPGYDHSLEYTLEEAATQTLAATRRGANLPLGIDTVAPLDRQAPIRRLTLEDWLDYFGLRETARPASAGDGRIFGDVTLNGTVDIIDAFFVVNVAVGNRPLLTDSLRDNAIAADVTPANLPGLGEATDPIPPGQEADGSFNITVLDAAAIANEAVGNDRPVAGEPIPGRQARPFRTVITGNIAADRTLTRDTVYELQGTVNVSGGATLTIQAGTLLEGDGASNARLVIRRGGNIDWRGTRLEPIVFTCKGAVKTPGCWGGVVVNGLSLLNTPQTGDPIPICPEKVSIGNPGFYGGCLVEDTSGVMHHIRIEYAGQPVPGTIAPTPGLALLGVGTGTVVDRVQVHGSSGDGLFLSGGTVNLRHLVLTANGGAGLGWDDGYGGSGTGGGIQFLVIQQASGGGPAIRGSNSADLPDAMPRSSPQAYNATLVGAGAGGVGDGRGWVLLNGSAGALHNAIVLQMPGAGFDITGPESCAQAGAGSLELDHAIFFGNTPDFATDADCIDETGFALNPARANRTTDPGLIAAASTLTPDWRPVPGAPAASGPVTPPSNQFFDATVTYVGAVDPANATGSNIPWYAGWSRGWSGMP